MRVWVSALVAGIGLVLTPAAAEPTRAPILIGYVAAFKGLQPTITNLPPNSYSHLNIAFANPDSGGKFVAGSQLACMPDAGGSAVSRVALRRAVQAGQEGGAKVLVSVGGGVIPDCSGDWSELLTPARRSATVAGLIALLDEFGLDGVDVDIEGVLLTKIDKAGNYTPFIAELSAALRARDKLLTCATASYEGGMIPVASIPYFDLVNVMSYDAVGPSWGPAGAEHSPLAGAEQDLRLWLDRGVAPERLVLGVPFYGYGFGGLRPNWSYRDILVRHGEAAARSDVVGQACAGCAYITYNSPGTLERKAALARDKGAGVMVWEVSQDTGDFALTRAILDVLQPPK